MDSAAKASFRHIVGPAEGEERAIEVNAARNGGCNRGRSIVCVQLLSTRGLEVGCRAQKSSRENRQGSFALVKMYDHLLPSLKLRSERGIATQWRVRATVLLN
jgi:hypothetical protein